MDLVILKKKKTLCCWALITYSEKKKKPHQKQDFKQSNLLIHKHNTRLTLHLRPVGSGAAPVSGLSGGGSRPILSGRLSTPVLCWRERKIQSYPKCYIDFKLMHCAVYSVSTWSQKEGKHCLPANTSAGAALAGAEVQKSWLVHSNFSIASSSYI